MRHACIIGSFDLNYKKFVNILTISKFAQNQFVYLDMFADVDHALGNQVFHVNTISHKAVDNHLYYTRDIAVVNSQYDFVIAFKINCLSINFKIVIKIQVLKTNTFQHNHTSSHRCMVFPPNRHKQAAMRTKWAVCH